MPDEISEHGNDDYWKKAVDMLTGYVLPPRDKLFENYKGNEGIPLMHVRFDSKDSTYQSGFVSEGGWRSKNTDYVIPFYVVTSSDDGDVAGRRASRWWAYITLLGTLGDNKEPPSGEDTPRGGQGKSGVLVDGGDRNKDGQAVEWDSLPLAQYSHGSAAALDQIRNHPYSTYGFSNREQKVPDGAHVDLTSFTEVGKAFDRVVAFFTSGAQRLEGWDDQQIGEDPNSWTGTGASLFKHIVHKLARNYDGYADQLAGDGEGVPEDAVGLDGYSPTSNIGRALANLQTTLKKEANNLYNAWLAWRPESSPLRWLYDLLQEVHLDVLDRQHGNTDIDYVSSGGQFPTTHMFTEATAGFSQTIRISSGSNSYQDLGRPQDIATWKKLGEEAVARWDRSVQGWLSTQGATSIVAIQKAFDAAYEAFEADLSDRDTRSIDEIANREQNEKDRRDARKDREEAKRQAEEDREEARRQAEKDRAEAKAYQEEQRAQAERDREEARRQAEEDRAEAKAYQEEQRAEAEKDREEARAYQQEQRAEAERQQEEARRRAEHERAEAEKEQAKAKAEAEQERAQAREQAEKEREEQRAYQEEQRAQAEQDRANAIAHNQQIAQQQERERAKARKEQEEARAEAEREQEAARSEAEKQRADAAARAEQEREEAKAYQEEQRAQAEKDREEQRAYQEEQRAQVEQEREEARARQEEQRAEAEQARDDARREQTQARYELEQEKSEAREEYERAVEDARAERESVERQADREVAQAREEYDRARAEAQEQREEAREQAERERAEAKKEYDRQVAEGRSSVADARAAYEDRIAEINAREEQALEQADAAEAQAKEEYDRVRSEAQSQREAAQGESEAARRDAKSRYDRWMDDIQSRYDQVSGGQDLTQAIKDRIASLPTYSDTPNVYSPYAEEFGGNGAGQGELTAALGRETSPAGAGQGGFPPPMMPPQGGNQGNNGERSRQVLDSAVNRVPGRSPGRSVDQDNVVVRSGMQTSSGMPFTPPMAGGAPGDGQSTTSSDRERGNWLTEEEDVWGTDEGGAPQALGR